MHLSDMARREIWWGLALVPPLLMRLLSDGFAQGERLHVLVMALFLAYGWGFLFARLAERPLGAGLLPLALLFALLLPGPVHWLAVVISVSFGVVFGRELFGGRPILPPVLLALTFAIFSYPDGGFEATGILARPADPLFLLTCLPGALWLMWKGLLAWRVAAGAAIGTLLAAFLAGLPAWWEQLAVGNWPAAVLFLAAAPEAAPRGRWVRWIHGVVVGALVVLFRTKDPTAPDGVLFAILLGALFAPLLDRALTWRRAT